MNAAITMMENSRDGTCTTSTCYSAILFLSDGEPTVPPSSGDLARWHNSDNGLDIFTYFLGSDPGSSSIPGDAAYTLS